MCLPQGVDVPATLAALERRGAIQRYVWLQQHRLDPVPPGSDYRRRFNGYYRLQRQSQAWYNAFYGYFSEVRELLNVPGAQLPTYADVLQELHNRCGRVEASFASKLLATLDPNRVVLDRIVLRRAQLALPARNIENRQAATVHVYEALVQFMQGILTCRTIHDSSL